MDMIGANRYPGIVRAAANLRCKSAIIDGEAVSKHALAPYRSGRSRTWLKTKCFTESTFVVAGTDRDRKTGALRALLAHTDDFGLTYAGAAFVLFAARNETASSLRLSASRPLGVRS